MISVQKTLFLNGVFMGYDYYFLHKSSQKLQSTARLAEDRFSPQSDNPDYIVLLKRREILANWISTLPQKKLTILDVGGRVQPYRQLFGRRIHKYVALDPIYQGPIDIVGLGESLPFKNRVFDTVICTQVLTYVFNPQLFIDEIHRVLKIGGVLLLSVPAFFPKHHDERWRFLPGGLEILLHNFNNVKIIPEGRSGAGICRTISIYLNSRKKRYLYQRINQKLLIPLTNKLGVYLDKFSKDDQFCANYCVYAEKKAADERKFDNFNLHMPPHSHQFGFRK